MQATTTTTSSPYDDDLLCPDCGYSLRGLTSERCPECGLDLDFIESDKPVIPWERRREIGRVRAYWQTVFQVMFHGKVFCRAMYRQVDYTSAQRFRWISILLTFVAAMLCQAVLHVIHPNLIHDAAAEMGWWFIGLCWGTILLALAVFTGLPSYFFHPRSMPTARQNRSVALSFYGCTPLALGPLGPLLAGVGAAIWRTGDHEYLTWLIPSILALISMIWCWITWSSLARRTLLRGERRLLMTWTLPVLWLVGSGLILVGIPAIAYFLAVVFYSLRPISLVG